MSAPQQQTGAEQLDLATQRELATFIEQEQTKAKLQATIHDMTSMCWDKCVTSSIGARFSKSEGTCLLNCVDRFLDTSKYLVKHLEERRG
ncbi:mitochondrial import inner membrane translocase subunit TIM8 [Leucosporidium creatinivorum]|uniref:Mitochondrial import inner membrane translocase subunit n=1 Tax=Leucosporidium creatinivorum TaxID=106004 RepID=A0A1Y2G2Q1_9BASI|nr:mitochondrial import inner membrane translocase subunit TIM8 [Leucosporidium creatinivorum]